jgi:hypothetical protein
VLNDRENILSALREKPLKVYEVMKRANVVNEEACQSLLLKMRDEGLVKFDIHKGRWLIKKSTKWLREHQSELLTPWSRQDAWGWQMTHPGPDVQCRVAGERRRD